MLRNYFLIMYSALAFLTACNCDRQPNEKGRCYSTSNYNLKLQKLEILTNQPGSGKEAKNGTPCSSTMKVNFFPTAVSLTALTAEVRSSLCVRTGTCH